MKDPSSQKKNRKHTVSNELSSKGSDALTEFATPENREAFGSPSGGDPDPKKNGKPKKRKGEVYADSETETRWKLVKVGDVVNFLIRDFSGEQVSGEGEVKQIYNQGDHKAVHVEGESGKVHVCVNAEELTAIKPQKIEETGEIVDGEQLILPGTLTLSDAVLEVVNRRVTWDDALGELEAFDAFMDERRKVFKDLRSKVRECRKLYLTAKRTAMRLGWDPR